MSSFQIALLPGDGIGPDVVNEAVKVLRALEPMLDGVRFAFQEFSVGAGEFQKSGDPLPPATLDAVSKLDAILLGAMGLPSVRYPNGTELTPQIDLREKLDLYIGLRPIKLYHTQDTPLKKFGAGEIDFLIIRENTEGLFFSRHETYDPAADDVRDTMCISRKGAERICRSAFEHAMRRRKFVSLVDKANVLPSMAYLRGIFDGVARDYPEIRTERIYVDAASLYLIQRPHTFDVLVTENMFGDILSDLAAGLVGGMGMAPSADIGERYAVFQPSHGSAPDIAGKGIANPVATILSAAMMLEWWDQPETLRGAKAIYSAVEKVFADASARTPDMGGTMTTWQMGDRVASALSL